MKLRLYHHHDGARIAYREAGTGPPLALFHAIGLTHREWEPLVEGLADRFRLVLPDLPLHGDSEERPRHPYTRDWMAEVVAGFCHDTLGGRPLVAGHGFGAELLLHAVVTRRMVPARLVLMPCRLHGPYPAEARLRGAASAARVAWLPGVDRVLTHGAALLARRRRAHGDARDELFGRAFADAGGNSNLARAWAKLARRWPMDQQLRLLDDYPELRMPVLLLWADGDPAYPLELAEEALARLPDAQLRVLSATGASLVADDPVGVARELAAFCR